MRRARVFAAVLALLCMVAKTAVADGLAPWCMALAPACHAGAAHDGEDGKETSKAGESGKSAPAGRQDSSRGTHRPSGPAPSAPDPDPAPHPAGLAVSQADAGPLRTEAPPPPPGGPSARARLGVFRI